ncbi:hypothetical protein DEU56DRAFT_901159 [Suillus clintonianus]|uniref:uncharacterized protein n=1 Tax=Suillus clintonianus TaxID=1904413 RepID=UPI001B86C385|nr:uncharacterized protein DEU56DRAFT_901159 [Suillus clintonianus]KAG2138997.1 hypothetical protein DEU56DRAFT_901159 [Suillus clintonianus]
MHGETQSALFGTETSHRTRIARYTRRKRIFNREDQELGHVEVRGWIAQGTYIIILLERQVIMPSFVCLLTIGMCQLERDRKELIPSDYSSKKFRAPKFLCIRGSNLRRSYKLLKLYATSRWGYRMFSSGSRQFLSVEQDGEITGPGSGVKGTGFKQPNIMNVVLDYWIKGLVWWSVDGGARRYGQQTPVRATQGDRSYQLLRESTGSWGHTSTAASSRKSRKRVDDSINYFRLRDRAWGDDIFWTCITTDFAGATSEGMTFGTA